MKSLEVLEVSAKIGVGVGVGTAVCIATLKGAMHLCDACYNAGKKLQNEIIKKQKKIEETEETRRHEEAMKILDDALGSDESSEA